MEPYVPELLPNISSSIDVSFFLDELVEATASLEVFADKIRYSKIGGIWFLSSLQTKEAVNSALLEGTQTTLDGVFVNEIERDDDNKSFNEIINYGLATDAGFERLRRGDFNDDLFCAIHKALLTGNVRKSPGTIGEYRTTQNYIGRKNGELIYTPPKPEAVPNLMNNLIQFINADAPTYHPLIRVAIIHAQFETIHPFNDGNGRVGRILIPLYLYAKGKLPGPYFFISEALERDKHKYYKYLMDTRDSRRWNEWIKFFLGASAKQCQKYSSVINQINDLYEKTVPRVCDLIKAANAVNIVNTMFHHPVLDVRTVAKETEISPATVNRYLNTLVANNILFTDGKQRNRHFFFYDFLSIIRD